MPAIDWFGTNDKRALRVSMFAVIGVIAVLVGIGALRSRWTGVGGFAAFGALGAVAALHRPNVPGRAVIPPLVGAVVGAWFVVLLAATLMGSWRASRTPRRSRAPLGVDRRRFLAVTGAAAAVAAVSAGSAGALERRRVNRIRGSAPARLPDVLEPATTH